eukprot:9281-Pyramimonas_sp.AAC.1
MLCVKDIRVTRRAPFYYLKPSGLFPTYISVGETLQGVCHACMRGGAVCYDATETNQSAENTWHTSRGMFYIN